ncbi:MAG: chloride channel protein [Erysipelotrichaceae bacterium]|nr:chloride channel protein [Erysipelotrichaceae bacterium]
MKETEQPTSSWFAQLGKVLQLGLLGIGIGLVVAVFEAVFGNVLKLMIGLHRQHPGLWLLFLPAAGLIIVWMFENPGKKARKGINLVFEVSQGLTLRIPKRLVAVMAASTWISQLAGASVGREGVAIQIGATVSHVIGRWVPWFRDLKGAKTIFLVTGMAAGFAGLFQTPFTAVFFALEVLVAGTLKYRALPSAICASFSAWWAGSLLGLGSEAFALGVPAEFDLMQMGWKLALLGMVFGAAGGGFARTLKWVKAHSGSMVSNPYLRAFIMAVLLAGGLALTNGRYSNMGVNLISAPFAGGRIYAWDWLLKALFTVASLAAGFTGGEVTPMFAIGSALGFWAAPFLGVDPVLGAALGYAAVFGAGTNTWLAAMMAGMEIFGYQYFPFFFVACSAAYLMNHNDSIYALQRRYEDGREA